MKKKLLVFYFILFFVQFLPVYSQTGPGGVGSSTNNKLWLDANTGITLTGSSVTAWADRSGNANNAAPNAAANRPTYVVSSTNGNASLDFDGTDDELRVTDNAGLDLTSWHIFLVVIVDVQKDYNAWFVKGNDGQENYEQLSYSDGNIHSPLYFTDGTRTFPNSASGQVTTTEFNIIEYTYSAAVGRDVYKNMTSIHSDNENKTPQTNGFDLYIGNERTTSRFINGDFAEAILYNAPLNNAERFIVLNYLASKYNLTLPASDFYAGDTPGNGNFDYEVAGVGRETSATVVSNQANSTVSGGLQMVVSSGFNNNDYLLYGHQTGANAINYTDIAGMSAGPLVARWNRIWYFDFTHGGANETVDLTFDISDGGMTAVPATPLSNYKLLYRAGTSGAWTEVMNASSIAGDRITFTGVAYSAGRNDGYYTIGTLDNTISPLPIELIDFTAHLKENKVDLAWTTASETNNDFFTIEKSRDGQNFEELMKVDGAGNTTTIIDYYEIDQSPFTGISYYRLKQTDFNGSVSYSNIVPVEYNPSGDSNISLFPNPADVGSQTYLELNKFEGQEVLVVLRDIQGREVYSKVVLTMSNNELVALNQDGVLSKGTYLITASSANKLYSKRLIVK